MNNEERKDYLKYIENYTINDLADMFNTQNFVIQDKDKFNEILLYYHFKQNEEIEQLQKENKKYKEVIEKAIELNKQVIKDTKEFYRPTKDIIYSGDTLIDIAEQNLKILKEVE